MSLATSRSAVTLVQSRSDVRRRDTAEVETRHARATTRVVGSGAAYRPTVSCAGPYPPRRCTSGTTWRQPGMTASKGEARPCGTRIVEHMFVFHRAERRHGYGIAGQLVRDREVESRVARVRVFALGVKPDYQHTGVAARFYQMHFEAADRTPQKTGELGWVLETNRQMNRAMSAWAGSSSAVTALRAPRKAPLPNGAPSADRADEPTRGTSPTSRLCDAVTRWDGSDDSV